ncbi:MAG TPA: hypothetical protein VFV50_11830 [Bdellovibrionales bacterium]|nr:hypothetical protein [Bdellovibrionales bacterium]
MLIIVAASGPFFRLAIYHKLPVTPGNPVGLGDIIEVMIYSILILLCFISICGAILHAVVPSMRDKKAALWLALTPVAAYAGHYLFFRFGLQLLSQYRPH